MLQKAGVRRRWRTWRRTRPFYAGLLMIAGATVLVAVSWVDLGLLRLTGTAGAATWTISTLLTVARLTTWTGSSRRHFTGGLAVLLALCSLITANLGGLLLGFFFAATGGCLALAWTPLPQVPLTESRPESSGRPHDRLFWRRVMTTGSCRSDRPSRRRTVTRRFSYGRPRASNRRLSRTVARRAGLLVCGARGIGVELLLCGLAASPAGWTIPCHRRCAC
ncbi:DUF6114 domain-containing protein [Streptomyces sp. NPDC021100]|uniref:DUF6114 domain-containing protein n=1 Tax=Streptomyces sp. NPDC021100 TaxID=3365114 RepID=UPI003798FF1E